ncbi:MAG: HNH endonuclease [Campylobacteraceae bacterium]|nr:HNH endonuclease [Campylobacteraceae bacterium]
MVFKRDNWRCVYCGVRATQVHHLKYARNIGREPIEWLVSVCNECHNSKHSG